MTTKKTEDNTVISNLSSVNNEIEKSISMIRFRADDDKRIMMNHVEEIHKDISIMSKSMEKMFNAIDKQYDRHIKLEVNFLEAKSRILSRIESIEDNIGDMIDVQKGVKKNINALYSVFFILFATVFIHIVKG